MEDFRGRILLYLISIILAVAIGLIWAILRRRNTICSRPTGDERDKLIAEVNVLKHEGYSYKERKKHLRQLGLNSDNADELIGEAERLSK